MYPARVMFCINENNKRVKGLLEKYGIEDHGESFRMETSTGGRYVHYFNTDHGIFVLIRVNKKPTKKNLPTFYSALSHEIFHAAEAILSQVGMVHEYKVSSEAYAYLISYLTRIAIHTLVKEGILCG